MTTLFRRFLRRLPKKLMRERLSDRPDQPVHRVSTQRLLARLARLVRLATGVSLGPEDLGPLAQRVTVAILASLALLVQRVHSALLARLALPGTQGFAARVAYRARPDQRAVELQVQLDRLVQLGQLAAQARLERRARRELQGLLGRLVPLVRFGTTFTYPPQLTHRYRVQCGTVVAASFSRAARGLGQAGS